VESALYVGTVRHRRLVPRPHRFAYPLFQLYADLDELDTLFAGSWLASTRRPAWAWLRRGDHFGPTDRPWADAVRDEAARSLGRRPAGAVRLLTHPRTAGFRMNPVSFFYLHDAAGALDALVAEVTNTPWDERHLYVIDAATDRRRGAVVDSRFAKAFHVSPYFPMALDYRWRFTAPGERLLVHMESSSGGRRVFDATLRLERRALDPRNLRRTLVAYPAMTLRVFLWIYTQAALLRFRGAIFHPHPRRTSPPATAVESSASSPASASGSRGDSSKAA
jgi:DUF1365 family protein